MLTARRRWVSQQLEDELERESEEVLQQQQQPRKKSNNKEATSKPLRRRRIVVRSSSKSVGFATMSASAFSVVEGGSNGRSHRSTNGEKLE